MCENQMDWLKVRKSKIRRSQTLRSGFFICVRVRWIGSKSGDFAQRVSSFLNQAPIEFGYKHIFFE